MNAHFADRLLDAIRDKGAPVCVGLDPVFDRLPQILRRDVDPKNAQAAAHLFEQWGAEVIEAVAPYVPCIKIQSACFERYLWPGVQAHHKLIVKARQLGLIVIGDAKRGDIGVSSDHYAAANLADNHFTDLGDAPGPDALTVNGYLGADALAPFIDAASRQGKGLFVLVRTSNPGGDALQTLPLQDGRQVCDAVADMVAQLGAETVAKSQSGFSLLGAVVGATKPQDAARLRLRMPDQWFLVPGFGAQGAGADDVRACFKPNRTGAIITASRSVIYAHQSDANCDWRQAVAQAAKDFKLQIHAMLA